MQTEWHNYYTASKRLAGAYGYLPDVTDDALLHVYISKDGYFVAVYFIAELVTLAGPIQHAKTLAGAKTAAMRHVVNHVDKQGSLKLSPHF